MNTNIAMLLENQLLATKFYVPVTSGTLISRPRLTALLDESLKRPLTLISAPAGFGKTTLLSTWSQSLAANTAQVVWISLDEEDNEPQLFWINILAALVQKQPDLFTPLLKYLQSPQAPSLKAILTALINRLLDSTEQFLLILDDYHVISEQQVHSTLSYLVEHLPAQFHIILATRADPLLPLPQLRARQQMQEIRGDQLRCTVEETAAFFHEVMGLDLPEETSQEVTVRTEGWLVGLQLLRLSLPERADPLSLLQEVSGDQRYILDYLIEEVLQRQPQEVQTFLLSTSILEHLSASLCDAIMEQTGSQQMLQRLEKANLFVVSLDSKRQWYRYHALFAEALRHQLEQTSADLAFALHHRASLWYAKHDRSTQAILHAFRAQEWQWAADLLEHSPSLLSHTWGASEHELGLLRQWLEQLPADIVHSRPRLCLACTQLLWAIAPYSLLQGWLDAAEATLTASLTPQMHEHVSHTILSPQVRQEQENLLSEVIAGRAFIQCYEEDGEAVLTLCQRALALASADNGMVRALVAVTQILVYYGSAVNNAVAAIEHGLRLGTLTQTAGLPIVSIGFMSTTITHMIGTGQLREAQRLALQAIQLGTQPGGLVLPEVGWISLLQAEILREWNQLDAAQELAVEAIPLCKQVVSLSSVAYLLIGYEVLLRIHLSRRELNDARSALQQIELMGTSMNQPSYIHHRSHFATIDQVRLWLACGEPDRATQWAQKLDLTERHGTPFAYEREEVAHARILLAKNQPDLALQRLEPVLLRATTGQRWGHVIEIRLLQARACQMRQEETQALDALSEAIRLAEPEGYIRSFVEEGAPMETLLYRLRKRDRKHGPTPYLDTLLAAFQQESIARPRAEEPTKAQPLPEPLSEREIHVLHLLSLGASNQEIAQELVIVIDTVKRHVSHIFSKLGVQNRVQAVRQAQELGLLGEES